MPLTHFKKGFPGQVSILDVPFAQQNGKVFWVNNSSVLPEGGLGGSNGNDGLTPETPFGTIDYAIGQCKAGRGDTIYVAPGHVETIASADAVDIDVDGVSIIGLGYGSDQARFDHTDATGRVSVNADNVLLENLNFHSNITLVANGLRVVNPSCVVRNCLFDVELEGTDEFNKCIDFKVGAHNGVVEDCVFDMGLGGGAIQAIKLTDLSDGVTIRRNRIVGDYSTANINSTTTAQTNFYIEDNLLLNGGSGNINAQPVIELLTGTTGVVRDNHSLCNLATIAAHTVADTMLFFENWATEDVGAAAAAILRTAAASVTASADD